MLAKLRELHHHELLRKHYVRTYYFLQLFAAIGYLWIGINKLIDEPTADPLHMVTLGGILGSMMMIWLTADYGIVALRNWITQNSVALLCFVFSRRHFPEPV